MALEIINIGASPNDGQGDPIRTAFEKCNTNFGNLWARAQVNPPATLVGSTGDFAGMYAYDSQYFYYCFADYDGSSVIWAEIPNTVIDAIEIANGTSNVSIPTANGNVTVSVANIPNVAVFSSGGANFTSITASAAVINGDLTVTGNANLSGNIVGDRITNGTTSIEIPVVNGNATVTVGNIANVVVFTTSGLVANVITATGNVTGSNFTTAGLMSATGNVTAGNVSAIGTVTAPFLQATANLVGGNIVLAANTKIRGEFSVPTFSGRPVFQTSNVSVDSPTTISALPGDNNANTLLLGAAFSAFSSANTANSTVVGVFAYANQSALRTAALGSATLQPLTFLFNQTEVARFSTDGNLGVGNTAPADRLAVEGNAYVSGNINSGNLTSSGTVTAGDIVVNGTSSFAGNLMPAANITYDIGNSTNRWNDIWLANSTIYLGDAQLSANATALVLTNPSGAQTVFSGSQSTVTAATVSAAGNVTGGNVLTSGVVSAAGNITTSGGIFIGNGSGLTGVVAVGNVGAASQFTNGTTSLNIPVPNGNIIGNIGGSTDLFEFSTVGLSAAGNITANNINVNNGLSVAGNVTGANVTTSGQISATGNITSAGVFVGDGSGLTNVTGNVGSASQLTSGTTQINIPVASGNIVANVAGSTNLFQWSTVGFSAVGNITGGNLLTSGLISAAGNATAGNIVTSGAVSATGNLSGGNLNISGNIVDTGALRLVTGGGGAISLAPNASNVAVVSTAGLSVTGLASASGNVTAANFVTAGLITATGNITAGNLSGTNITGTLSTAAQTNITSVGTLGSLSVSGNITAGNLSVNTGTVSVGAIVNNNANGVGNIGTDSTRFNTVFALASSAQYADLAERYLADHPYPAGTVVAFGGSEEVTLSDQDHDVTVAGIVSDRPAYEMNAALAGDHVIAIALAGRVPCQVVGPIRRGQMLVSAGSGRARAETNPRMGAVIGKALEDFDGTTGTIEVVVGRI